MFFNFVWPQKLANIPACYVFLIQVIEGNCIFSHSLARLANMVQDRTVDKHTPPSRGLRKGTKKGSRVGTPGPGVYPSFRHLWTKGVAMKHQMYPAGPPGSLLAGPSGRCEKVDGKRAPGGGLQGWACIRHSEVCG